MLKLQLISEIHWQLLGILAVLRLISMQSRATNLVDLLPVIPTCVCALPQHYKEIVVVYLGEYGALLGGNGGWRGVQQVVGLQCQRHAGQYVDGEMERGDRRREGCGDMSRLERGRTEE